jgi:hypothetical protein
MAKFTPSAFHVAPKGYGFPGLIFIVSHITFPVFPESARALARHMVAWHSEFYVIALSIAPAVKDARDPRGRPSAASKLTSQQGKGQERKYLLHGQEGPPPHSFYPDLLSSKQLAPSAFFYLFCENQLRSTPDFRFNR